MNFYTIKKKKETRIKIRDNILIALKMNFVRGKRERNEGYTRFRFRSTVQKVEVQSIS